MGLIIMKPVHWNPKGYKKPAGFPATSGYPKETGFGHEEWNNSPLMRFRRAGVWYRALHTEPIGDVALEHPGEVTLFLYASHNRRQELVGIAAKATYLAGKEAATERAILRDSIGLDELGTEAWEVSRVQARFTNDKLKFAKHWTKNVRYMPSWICPEAYFLWLEQPALLHSQRITGKEKLLTMFTRYTAISAEQASQVMAMVPKTQRSSAWSNISRTIEHPTSDLQEDIAAIERNRKLSKTTRQALVAARLGQGRFRAELIRRWDGACAVTGCRVADVLRASHVLSWKDSNNRQRLDGADFFFRQASTRSSTAP